MDNITLTPSDFVVGSFYSNGTDYYRTDRIRASDIIITTTSLRVNIVPNISKTLQFVIASFDANGNLVDYIGTWQDNGNTVQLSNTAVKIKIAIRATDNIDMQPNYITSCSIVTSGWIMQNGELTNTDFLSLPDKPFHGDSPYTMWRIDPNANDGMPYVPLMIGVPVLSQSGAFKDATNLVKVRIPQSCSTIGKHAFEGTQLTKVTIASDCTYYNTSFPDGCVVNFYPD